ncbi:ATP-binding cassette domain-containing protein, partial [Nocardia wallacei]|uniref:ATP-binding cassette domain-containing protein n=1 Tax=Nocardia wallacei TaxID=480035 RepID=UPI00245426AD
MSTGDDAGLEVSIRVAERDVEVELSVAPGEVLAVLGPNGAGKSTVLEVVAGLVAPDGGWVRLAGRTLTDVASGVAVPPHRREISLLAQDPLLFPHLTAAANVAFGPRSRDGRARAAAVAPRWLDPGAETLARDLAGRESSCCSFFAFDFTVTAEGVVMGVGVPPTYI